MDTFNSTKWQRVDYVFNPATSHYQKKVDQPEKYPVAALPYELKRELTRGKQIQPNAEECLTKNEIKKENGSRVMFTGLRPLSISNWFLGDTYRMNKGKKINSLLIIHFSDDNSEMRIYYFSGYYKKYPDDRARFAISFILNVAALSSTTDY